jgi:dTDP-4-dehydrorhamnose reductase
MATLLITGGAGRIASSLRPRLTAAGHRLVLLDEVDLPTPPTDTERFVSGPIADRDALDSAVEGVDAIVHLAGIPTENTWEALTDANVDGTRLVLEAAARHEVRQVFLASSIHAVGRVPEEDDHPASVPGDRLPRPDTYYGVTKAVMELFGSLFADRYGMTIVSARIGAFGEEPGTRRALRMWSSPDDLVRLVEALLALEEPGHHVVWAVSRNTGSPADFSAGERIGFSPQDDAADVLDAATFDAMPEEDMQFLGGGLAHHPLGVPRT